MKPRHFLRAALCPLILGALPSLEAQEENAPDPVMSQILPESAETGSNVDGQHVIIYKEEGAYTPFPSLYVDEAGNLITQFSRRTSRRHIEAEGATRIRMKSEDGGLSWKKVPLGDTLPPLPQWKKEDGTLVQVRDEGWIYTDASKKEELEAKGYLTRDASDGRIAYGTPTYVVMRSSDGGATWEREQVAAPDYVKSLYHLFASHSTVLASNGARIRVLEGMSHGEDTKEVFVLRSEDDGETWEFIRLQPDGSGEVGFGEPAVIETADNRLLTMMRSQPEGYLWQSFSDDFGKTWSEPASSGLIGHPAHLLNLPDGRLLCTYGYRRNPMGVRAAISKDNGKTWEAASEFIIRADGKHRPGDQGYPTSVLLEDGSIFTIYYITREDNNTHIAGTKWNLK